MYNPQLTVDRIKEMRELKGVSLAELNEACGLNRNTIAVSANSKTGLSAKILSNISEILGCSVDYLLGKTDNPTKTTNNVSVSNPQNFNGTQNNGIIQSPNERNSSDDERLLEMIKSLDLIERSRIIVMIDEMRKGA